MDAKASKFENLDRSNKSIDSFLEKKDGRKRSPVGWKEGRECVLAIASNSCTTNTKVLVDIDM